MGTQKSKSHGFCSKGEINLVKKIRSTHIHKKVDNIKSSHTLPITGSQLSTDFIIQISTKLITFRSQTQKSAKQQNNDSRRGLRAHLCPHLMVPILQLRPVTTTDMLKDTELLVTELSQIIHILIPIPEFLFKLIIKSMCFFPYSFSCDISLHSGRALGFVTEDMHSGISFAHK